MTRRREGSRDGAGTWPMMVWSRTRAQLNGFPSMVVMMVVVMAACKGGCDCHAKKQDEQFFHFSSFEFG